jgi:hypothetical protein
MELAPHQRNSFAAERWKGKVQVAIDAEEMGGGERKEGHRTLSESMLVGSLGLLPHNQSLE